MGGAPAPSATGCAILCWSISSSHLITSSFLSSRALEIHTRHTNTHICIFHRTRPCCSLHSLGFSGSSLVHPDCPPRPAADTATATAQALDLSQTGIGIFPPELLQAPRLRLLNLASNRLEVLPAEVAAMARYGGREEGWLAVWW